MIQSITIRRQNGKWVGEYFGVNANTMRMEFGTDAIAAHAMTPVIKALVSTETVNTKLAAYAKRHKIDIEVIHEATPPEVLCGTTTGNL